MCYRSCITILKQLCTLTWGPCQFLCTLSIADCPECHGTAWNMTTKASPRGPDAPPTNCRPKGLGAGPRETRQRLEYCALCWILHASATTHSTWGSASTHRLLLGQLGAPEVGSAEYYPQPRHGSGSLLNQPIKGLYSTPRPEVQRQLC